MNLAERMAAVSARRVQMWQQYDGVCQDAKTIEDDPNACESGQSESSNDDDDALSDSSEERARQMSLPQAALTVKMDEEAEGDGSNLEEVIPDIEIVKETIDLEKYQAVVKGDTATVKTESDLPADEKGGEGERPVAMVVNAEQDGSDVEEVTPDMQIVKETIDLEKYQAVVQGGDELAAHDDRALSTRMAAKEELLEKLETWKQSAPEFGNDIPLLNHTCVIRLDLQGRGFYQAQRKVYAQMHRGSMHVRAS